MRKSLLVPGLILVLLALAHSRTVRKVRASTLFKASHKAEITARFHFQVASNTARSKRSLD
jgi:hypothetical protein